VSNPIGTARPLTPQTLREMLEGIEWPVVTATVEVEKTGPDGVQILTQVDSGFRMQVCPYCAATLAQDREDLTFRAWHIDSHVDTLSMIYAAQSGML
jgi:hypothetical protein